MKLKAFLLISLAGATLAFSQAKSDVVGYETLTKNKGFNYLGLRLLEKHVATGTVSSVSGASVTLDSAPSIGSGTHLFEVNSGNAAGTVIEIAGVSGSTVTLTEDLSAELAASDSYTIRPAHTLASVFGPNNEVGLYSSGSYVGADQVWIPIGGGQFAKYAYLIANPFTQQPARWTNESGSTVDPSTVAINYADGVIINAQEAGEIVVEGAVKTSPTSYAITQNFNYFGTSFPAGSTLETAFGASNEVGLFSSGSFTGANQVWLPDGVGDFNKYAYLIANPFLGLPARWADDTGATIDPATVEITPGMIIVNPTNQANYNIEVNPPASYNSL